MNDKIHIIGAGLSGLVAANMLARLSPVILEASDSLPNNHSAVLRFRSAVVSYAVGIRFRRVRMIKSTVPWQNPVADMMSYSKKTGRMYRSDRSISSSEMVADRYIAPNNLIDRLARNAAIDFGKSIVGIDQIVGLGTPIISTIPMPALAYILDYPQKRAIKTLALHRPGFNIRAHIRNCDAYATVYVPSPHDSISRVSVTGNEMIVEVSSVTNEKKEDIAFRAAGYLGIDLSDIEEETIEGHVQKYAKILPIAENLRKDFIHWATVNYNVYSLGRYATWRPGVLLDDVINDIHLISGWINSQHAAKYDAAIHNSKVEAAE